MLQTNDIRFNLYRFNLKKCGVLVILSCLLFLIFSNFISSPNENENSSHRRLLIKNDDDVFEEDKDTSDLAKVSQKPYFREVLILGDSLLVVPEMFFQLTNVLQKSLTTSHSNFDVEISAVMKGGITVHNISTLVFSKFMKRELDKKPFPDAVIIHANSDYLDETNHQHYERKLENLLRYLKRRVSYITVVGPGLFSAQGEMPNHWSDETQFSTVKVIKLQKRACHKAQVAHIDFRTKLQDALNIEAKNGHPGKDLARMIGQKKLWKDNGDLGDISTWDYKSDGGLYTFDGEHLNRRGTKMLLDLISEQVFSRKKSAYKMLLFVL